MAVVAPVILRAFGVTAAIWGRGQDHRNQLSRTQYIWGVGVFSWGIGMFVFSIVSKYLEWRRLGDRFPYLSPVHIIVMLLAWLATGWLFGLLSARHREGTDLSGR